MYCTHSLYVVAFGLEMLLGVDSDIHTYYIYPMIALRFWNCRFCGLLQFIIIMSF